MKKNVMMRVASALLVAVLMTTCAISGTFAKYTTTKTETDDARVAYWGWGTSTLELDAFDDAYDATVDSSDGANVIAPGTSKTFNIQLKPATGVKAPEVAYQMTFAIDTVAANTDPNLFAKLEWSLNGGTFGTFGQLQSDLASIVNNYDANELPADAPAFNITWRWVYSVDEAGDLSDTEFGEAGTATVKIKFTINVTQLD